MVLYYVLGGDPTGTGKGGVSIYGECFDDEIHDDLKHTGTININIFCNSNINITVNEFP